MRARASTRPSSEDGHSWHVVDDLARDCPITSAELDAVEAFGALHEGKAFLEQWAMEASYDVSLLRGGPEKLSGNPPALARELRAMTAPGSGFLLRLF